MHITRSDAYRMRRRMHCGFSEKCERPRVLEECDQSTGNLWRKDGGYFGNETRFMGCLVGNRNSGDGEHFGSYFERAAEFDCPDCHHPKRVCPVYWGADADDDPEFWNFNLECDRGFAIIFCRCRGWDDHERIPRDSSAWVANQAARSPIGNQDFDDCRRTPKLTEPLGRGDCSEHCVDQIEAWLRAATRALSSQAQLHLFYELSPES
jgi:hypothetical protein